MPARINIPSGTRFGRLTVTAFHSSASYGGCKWKCKCDCGNETIVLSKYLRNGRTKSCGCIQRIHGLSSLPEYDIWTLMLRRCYDSRIDKFACYGGRGITVCDEWRNDFTAFYRDMGPRPQGYTLERKDVDGNYCPDNCIWDTWDNQHRNKRSNVWLTLNGKRRLLMDWAKLTGISREVLHDRHERGWSDERTLTTPVVKARTRDSAGRFEREGR